MLGHVGLAGFGEGEVGPPALTEGCDEFLVHQLLKRGIDGPGAGPPCARRLLRDGLDQAITIGRRLAQQRQDGPPDIPPACPPGTGTEAGPESAARTKAGAKPSAWTEARTKPSAAVAVRPPPAPAALKPSPPNRRFHKFFIAY